MWNVQTKQRIVISAVTLQFKRAKWFRHCRLQVVVFLCLLQVVVFLVCLLHVLVIQGWYYHQWKEEVDWSKTRRLSDDCDALFSQQMKEFDNRIINSTEEKYVIQVCEETSFCNSLIPVLQGFSVKKKSKLFWVTLIIFFARRCDVFAPDVNKQNKKWWAKGRFY